MSFPADAIGHHLEFIHPPERDYQRTAACTACNFQAPAPGTGYSRGRQLHTEAHAALVAQAQAAENDRAGLGTALWWPLHERYRFTIDVAASVHNAKLPKFYTRDDDGLAQSWAGERVWCNPPYSVIRPWVEKAWTEVGAELIAMVIPADRTEQPWWQDLVESRRDQPGGRLWTRFYPGRWRFVAFGEDRIRPHARPPFGICLLLWGDNPPPPPPFILPGLLGPADG